MSMMEGGGRFLIFFSCFEVFTLKFMIFCVAVERGGGFLVQLGILFFLSVYWCMKGIDSTSSNMVLEFHRRRSRSPRL